MYLRLRLLRPQSNHKLGAGADVASRCDFRQIGSHGGLQRGRTDVLDGLAGSRAGRAGFHRIRAGEKEDLRELRDTWSANVEKPASAAKKPVPRLAILDSPYRRVLEPIVDYVNRVARQQKHRMVAVIIPELIEPHWYEYLLHHLYASRLRSRLFVDGGDRVMVITTPWRLRRK